jgi:hypothetical protein
VTARLVDFVFQAERKLGPAPHPEDTRELGWASPRDKVKDFHQIKKGGREGRMSNASPTLTHDRLVHRER